MLSLLLGMEPAHSARQMLQLARGIGWSGCARPPGCHPVQHARSASVAGRLGAEAPDRESDAWQQTERRPEPVIEEFPGLHQLIHQRLRTTMDVLGLEPEDE